jgi:cation:H+ antiporter
VAAAFVAAAAAIGLAGTRLAKIADELAVRTGIGEVLMGALLIGASTSLPGIMTSVITAAQGYPGIATSNALGGIAAQTAFLAVADLSTRKINLEHAAASVANLVQGALLIALLAIALAAANLPPVAIWGVSPATVLLVGSYLFGLRLLDNAGTSPMWRPEQTSDTQDEDEEEAGKEPGSTASLWLRFFAFAAVLGIAGYVVSQAGIAIATRTGLSETAVGALLTAIVTSLPELVIAVTAVRIGAFNLAVGNIIGGNCFDILFLAAADLAYLDGSIYGRFTVADSFLASAAILMVAVLLLGLLQRERHGIAGIGFESVLVLAIYALVVVVTLAT